MIKKSEMKIFYLEMTQLFDNFDSKLTFNSLKKKIIYGLLHKIAEFLVEDGQKQTNLVKNQLPAIPRYPGLK